MTQPMRAESILDMMIEGQATQRFTSGLWRGYYVQYGARHEQQQNMEFADGMVRGDGEDGIGRFRIEGEYRTDEDTVRVGWIKTYEAGHSLLYLGQFDGTWINGHYEFAGGYRGEEFGFAPDHLAGSMEDLS